MENRQLEHREVQTERREFPIVVICENITSIENVGMVFRICESMGVEKIIFTGTNISLSNKKLEKISRSTIRKVNHILSESILSEMEELQQQGFELIALEITTKSKKLTQYNFSPQKKHAIVIGSEQHGISAKTLTKVDESIEIPLYGSNTSINVVSALSIALYEITKQMNS